MKTKLHKILVRMSKYAVYSFIIQSIFCSLAFSHNSEAQRLNEIYLKIDIGKASLEDVFHEIEKNTGFNFAYVLNDLPDKTVTIPHRKRTLESILMSISEQTGVSFMRVKETIHVRKLATHQKGVIEAPYANQQTFQVSGKVSSLENGEPLPGVNILIKGAASGTVTDVNGFYSIEVPSPKATLVFSFIGYTTEEVEVDNRAVIDVLLAPDITALEEIVVVGYGTQKKITTIGAQSSIKSVDLKQPVSNLSNVITGRIAGVVGVQRSGEPGYDNA